MLKPNKKRSDSCNRVFEKEILRTTQSPLKKSSAVGDKTFEIEKSSNRPGFESSKDISLPVDISRESLHCFIKGS